MPIRTPAHKNTTSPGGCVSYHDSPNRAKYLSDIIHKIVSEEKAQETLNTSEAPQVRTEAEMRLSVLLGALQSLYEEEWPWVVHKKGDTAHNILTELKAIIDSA